MATHVAKGSRITKTCREPRLEAKESGNEIWGYAAIWDEVDLDGDIIRRGAFARSCREVIPAGKVALMSRHFLHGGDTAESIGVLYEGIEDDYGFLIKAKIFGTTHAADTRTKIGEAPGLYGLSVGWRNVAGGWSDMEGGGYEFTEMALEEVTVTMMPAQLGTLGTLEAKKELDCLVERVCALESRVADLCSARPKPEGTDNAAHRIDVESEIARQKRVLALIRKGIGNG